MAIFRDLSGNGQGAIIDPSMAAVDLSTVDAVVPNKNCRLRVTGAGNVIVRPPGGAADITIAAVAGESIPMAPGTIIRKTGTTATGLATTAF